MNFFHELFKTKLDAMRAAAPRATLHLLHESNGFSVYLGEAAAVQKACHKMDFGTFTDHAEDVLMDDPVLHLFVPLEHAIKFVDEVTSAHSVALVDVILADKVHAARYVMYAYFPRKLTTFQDHVVDILSAPKFDRVLVTSVASELPPYDAESLRAFKAEPIKPSIIKVFADKLKEDDADFWG